MNTEVKQPTRKEVERALHQLSLDNPKRAMRILTAALGLIEAKPERKCSYTWKPKR